MNASGTRRATHRGGPGKGMRRLRQAARWPPSSPVASYCYWPLWPLPLPLVCWRLSFDWALLGRRRAYGAASAILAMVVLIAVAYTTVLQVRETRIRRHESNRLMHFELIRLALDHREYWPS